MQKKPLFYIESLVGALKSGLVIAIRDENNRAWPPCFPNWSATQDCNCSEVGHSLRDHSR